MALLGTAALVGLAGGSTPPTEGVAIEDPSSRDTFRDSWARYFYILHIEEQRQHEEAWRALAYAVAVTEQEARQRAAVEAELAATAAQAIPYRVYVPVAGQWSRDAIAAIVCNAPFTWDCGWALAVIECESGFNPNVSNPAGPFNGLFQVLNGPFDVYLNAVEAHIQYVEWQRGIRTARPWPNCPK